MQNFVVFIKEVKYICLSVDPAMQICNNYCEYLFFLQKTFFRKYSKKIIFVFSIFAFLFL